MSAYQNDFDRVFLQFLLPSWGSLQYSMMKIERVVTINNTKMIAQSCQENGLKNIQNWISPLDWSGTTIWRLDCIYGWVKSTNLDRSAVIVKSATTPSTSYDHACNIHHVKTNGNIINQNLINPRCMLYKYHNQVVKIMIDIIHEMHTFDIYLHHIQQHC